MNGVEESFSAARAFFRTGKLESPAFRKQVLRKLLEAVEAYEDRILEALKLDLGKPGMEAYFSEILPVKGEIRYFLKHLDSWTRPEKVSSAWWLWSARCWIRKEPFGAALILAPWNYPFQLVLLPLIAAWAAGNTAVLKPSELAPATAALLKELLGDFDPGLVRVVEGDAETARLLLELPFDFFFFTGGNTVGKKVALAAAAHGAPCVLELGGLNPCLVDSSAPVEVAAKRIVWGKFFNAGQTCLAPNRLLVHRSVYEPLMEAMKRVILEFYGNNPLASPDLARLVNRKHFERIRNYLKEGRIVCGGKSDEDSLRVEPTLLCEVPPGADVLREEIFGPVLPVSPYEDLDAVLDQIAGGPAPLVLYLHARDGGLERQVLARTRSGGVCINDHLLQAGVHGLPFGGRGASGMGHYRGRHGFETFSQARSVLKQSTFMDIPLRYPPEKSKLPWMRKLLG